MIEYNRKKNENPKMATESVANESKKRMSIMAKQNKYLNVEFFFIDSCENTIILTVFPIKPITIIIDDKIAVFV